MKIGIHTVSFSYPNQPDSIADTLKDITLTCEKGGFYSIWPMDHYFQISFHGPPTEPMLEVYTTLSYMAGITSKVKLGALVTGVVYRYPGILAKTVTSLDVLSKGRAYLGIGAAWNQEESEGLGVPFPPLKERFERLEETLQIVKSMWSDKEEPFHGKYYTLQRPLNSPHNISKPHPPIVIGGMGEQKTLKLVAKYADGCNFFGRAGFDVLKHKLDVLKNYCVKFNRNYDDIEKTTLISVDLSEIKPEDLINNLKELRKLGFTQAILTIHNDHEITPLNVISDEVIPAVADL